MGLNKGYLIILTSACIWGTVGVFARWSGLTPIEITFYKNFIAGVCLLDFDNRA